MSRVRQPVVLHSGPVALTASVITHPRRAEYARRVADQDSRGVFALVLDPEPDGPPTALRTSLAAWGSIDPAVTHHLLVQDDMILSAGFLDRALRAAIVMPDAALSFFTLWDSRNGGAVRLGALAGAAWAAAASEYAPTAAVLLPRTVADGFVRFARDRMGTWPDDILLHQYLRRTRVPRFVAVPNTAEHADPVSLAGNQWRGPRRSVCWSADLAANTLADEGIRLEGMSVIPFVKYGRALCSVRAGPGRTGSPVRWHDIPAERYLSGLGIAPDRLRGESYSGTGVPEHIPREVRLAGFTLGVAAQADRSAVLSGAATPDPEAVNRAIATIGPGLLCHRYSAERIAELRDALAETAAEGLRLGHEHAAAGGKRVTSEAAVEVTGTDTPLRDCLVRGLLDHGWKVTTSSGNERSGRIVIDPSRISDGQVVITRKTAGHTARYVIEVGDVYGPGCVPNSRIGAIVFAAAMGRAHVIADDPATLVHPLHVEDLIRTLNRLVHNGIAGGSVSFPHPRPYRLDVIAGRIHRAVRPIPIEFASGATIAAVEEAAGMAAPDPDDGESGRTALDFGLRTYAQWLAYEYSAAAEPEI